MWSRRALLGAGVIAGGGALLSGAVRGDPGALTARADRIQAGLLADWAAGVTPASFTEMRRINREYDFMARTFLVLALANDALARPDARGAHLAAIDAVLKDTLYRERSGGQEVFLMPYGREGGWLQSGRSLFVDGEIALMMAARRAVDEDRWAAPLEQRLAIIQEGLEASPTGFLESYPDECWTFCHLMALAAFRLNDVVEGTDHSALIEGWLDRAREVLVHKETGLLVSGFTLDGHPTHGPEGSTVFLSATHLLLLDPDFARDQYQRARAELGGSFMDMGYAREWPESWPGRGDVDSGPIVPGLQASPSASGFALLAARAFGDTDWFTQLEQALSAADTIIAIHPVMAAMADNAVAGSVLLYAARFGPLWAVAR